MPHETNTGSFAVLESTPVEQTTIERNSVSERATLRRRVKQFYDWFNREEWEKCFAVIDPKLTAKMTLNAYAARMQAFKNVYGNIVARQIRVKLYLHEP